MIASLLEDVRRYPGPWPRKFRLGLRQPGFWALATFRMLQAAHRAPDWLRPLAKLAIKPWYLCTQLLTGVELDACARIGPGLYIGHFGGVFVDGRAVLGEHCNLSPGVTIGEDEGPDGRRGAPTIGDRVYIGPGAKLFGPIHIGDDVAIGANAVVNRDVPDGVTVGGVPAKVISHKGSAGLIELGQLLPASETPAARTIPELHVVPLPDST